MEEIDRKITAYALKNAIEHNGKGIPNSVLNSLFNEGLQKSEIKEVMPKINEESRRVNSLSIEEQKKEFQDLGEEVSRRKAREGMPELEEAEEGKVITRFAPSPSGPMHIGHAATGFPSSYYAKHYKGKFYLRIEDTNPNNIDPDAYNMIPEEANWLFGNVHKIIIQSDQMQEYYNFARELIEKGAVYVCTCKSHEDEESKVRKLCSCRDSTTKENLAKWEKMLNPMGYREGEAILRFKSDTTLNNPALIDFPLARIIESPHPRQGTKYKVWPLMNLCVTYDDLQFGFTHIIRGKEHADNAKRQAMIFEVFNKPLPKTYFLGRYNFEDLEISCSKTKAKIKSGEFAGWDDIRLPFLSALRKRGFQPEAFHKLAEQRGLSAVDKVISKKDYFELLSNFNREIIKDKAIKADIPVKGKEYTLLTPEGEKKKIYSEVKAKEGDIVLFKDIGYCKLNSKEFWFCHE